MLRELQEALPFQAPEPGSLCPGTEGTGMSTYVNLSSHLHSTIQILRPSQDGMKTEIGKEESPLPNLAQSSQTICSTCRWPRLEILCQGSSGLVPRVELIWGCIQALPPASWIS